MQDKDNPLTKKSLLDVIRGIEDVPSKWRFELGQQIGG